MRPRTPGELLRAAKIPAFLISDLVDIRYLTGLTLSEGSLLMLPRRVVLFVDDRYRFAAERDVRPGITVRDVALLPQILRDVKLCGCQAENVTMQRLRSWKKKFPNTKFVHKVGTLRRFRRSKEPDELRALKRAESITEELLRRVPHALKKGITELKLARQLNIWALELGADGLSFDPIVAFGTHTASPHHRPTARALKKGHIVQIDCGARIAGYCADRSEVYFTAKPTALQKRVFKTLCEARDAAMRIANAGASTHMLDRTAREILAREGMETAFTHSLGHGVGLDIHEGVTISSRAKEEFLLPHEVITIEPGAYFEGKFGMRVESMVYIGEK